METVPKQKAVTKNISERKTFWRRIHRGQRRNNNAEDEFRSDGKATKVHEDRALGNSKR